MKQLQILLIMLLLEGCTIGATITPYDLEYFQKSCDNNDGLKKVTILVNTAIVVCNDGMSKSINHPVNREK